MVRVTKLAGGKPIPLPKGEAGRIAAALIKQFKPCGDGAVIADFACTVSRPVYRGKPVSVCTTLTDNAPPSTPPHRRFVRSGTFRPNPPQGRHAGNVAIRVTESCRAPAAWNKDMRSVIQHELAHAADVATRVQSVSVDDVCRYVNAPTEITARVAQVAHELSSAEVRKAVRQHIDYAHPDDPVRAHEILYKSPTYNAVANCLTPKNKRKFLQLAARLWQSGRFGTLPSAGGADRGPQHFIRRPYHSRRDRASAITGHGNT